MGDLPLWAQIVALIGLPILATLLANYAMPRLRNAQADLGEAQAAEIWKRLAKKEVAAMVKRINILEKSDIKKTGLITGLEASLVDERGKRRELERGVGILVAQLTQAGIKPKWQPTQYKKGR